MRSTLWILSCFVIIICTTAQECKIGGIIYNLDTTINCLTIFPAVLNQEFYAAPSQKYSQVIEHNNVLCQTLPQIPSYTISRSIMFASRGTIRSNLHPEILAKWDSQLNCFGNS